MNRIRRHPFAIAVATAIVIALILIVGYGSYLAGQAGELPWQAQPTRIAITPFAGIPGFDPASTPVATPTPAP
jgi:hypothetical protein